MVNHQTSISDKQFGVVRARMLGIARKLTKGKFCPMTVERNVASSLFVCASLSERAQIGDIELVHNFVSWRQYRMSTPTCGLEERGTTVILAEVSSALRIGKAERAWLWRLSTRDNALRW